MAQRMVNYSEGIIRGSYRNSNKHRDSCIAGEERQRVEGEGDVMALIPLALCQPSLSLCAPLPTFIQFPPRLYPAHHSYSLKCLSLTLQYSSLPLSHPSPFSSFLPFSHSILPHSASCCLTSSVLPVPALYSSVPHPLDRLFHFRYDISQPYQCKAIVRG